MRVVENDKPKEVDPEVVTIVLKQSEVNALYCLSQFVGGDPFASSRKVIAQLEEILNKYKTNSNIEIQGTVYFKDKISY